jgi:hypothetical protein
MSDANWRTYRCTGKKRQRPKYRTWQIRQFLLKTGQKSVKNGQNRPIL